MHKRIFTTVAKQRKGIIYAIQEEADLPCCLLMRYKAKWTDCITPFAVIETD